MHVRRAASVLSRSMAREHELLNVLDEWRGHHVAIRVVADRDDIVAVFAGRLGARSSTKGESLFWPVALEGAASGWLEAPGIYAHSELLSDVRTHVGGFVVEFTQSGVTVNVRRLDRR